MALQRVQSTTVLLCLVVIFASADAGKLFYEPFAASAEPFSWSECGNGTLPGSFSDFSITPDPIPAPGDLKLSFQAQLTRDVAAPVKVEFTMYKMVAFMWVRLPCEKGFGSCTYDDICPLLEKLVCDADDKSDISCHCPFKKGDYKLTPTTVTIDDKLIPFPWVLVHGSYKVHVEASDAQGRVECLELQFTLA